MGEQKEQTNNAEQEKKTEQKTEQKQKAEWAKRLAQIKKSVGQVKKIIKTVTEYAEKAWGAAEESMDLTGTMNHLGSRMEKIGNTFARDYKKYGYASAEGYAKSFKKRIDKLNTQMTGYGMDGENATGLPKDAGLGIDPGQLAEFQVKIGSIAEASGMAGENILAMQKAMSMLSVNLASFSAVDTDQVMTDLTNALNGQSGALERYGIQLSDAMLNQYAYAAGAGALSASMTQQQQMQLRMLGILEQSSFAWGDQISKINSAASQYRIFQQQMTGLTQVIGNLFLPVAQAVLPVVNGMLIALNRVLTAIGFSAWGDNWLTDISASVGGGIGNVEKLTESIDKTETGLKDASAEAKRLRNYLMGIDELNVMEPEGSSNGNGHGNNSSSSGINFDFIGDSFGNYESVWDTALSGMKNKAQIFADEVGKILTPLSAVFENLFNGDFFGAGKETSNLVSGIFTWIADAIDKVDWQGLGRRIGEFLAGIDWIEILSSAGKVILNVIKGWGELLGAMMGKSPVIGGYVFFKGTFGLLETISKSKTMEGIAEKWSKASAVFKGLGKGVWEAAKDVEKSNDVLAVLGGNLNIKKFASNCKEALGEVRSNMSLTQKGLIDATTVFAEYNMLKDPFKELTKGSGNLAGNIGKIAGVATVASGVLYTMHGPLGLVVGVATAAAAAIEGVRDAVNEIAGQSIAEVLVGDISLEEFTETFVNGMQDVASGFDIVIQKGQEAEQTKQQVADMFHEIDKLMTYVSKGAFSVEEKSSELMNSIYAAIEKAIEAENSEYSLLLEGLGESASEGVIGIFKRDHDEKVASFMSLSERLDELNRQWEENAISAETFQEELEKINADLYSTAEAVDNNTQILTEFEAKAKEINFSSLITVNEDGSLTANIEEFSRQFKLATDKYEESFQKIEQANQLTSDILKKRIEKAKAESNFEDLVILEASLNEHEEKVNAAKERLVESLVGYSEEILTQLGSKIPEAVEKAKQDWEGMSKFARKVAGVPYEDQYVKKVVEQFVNEVANPIMGELQTYFEEKGIEGAAMATDCFDGIADAIFQYDPTNSKSRYEAIFVEKLVSGYEEIVFSEMKNSKEKFREAAHGSILGYADGIEQNAEEVSLVMNEFVRVNINGILQEKLEMHSPSKVFERYGNYTIEGFLIGIDNQQDFLTVKMLNLVMIIQRAFNELYYNFIEVGKQIIFGLQDGLTQAENVVYEEVRKIANNISAIFKGELEINSPSKVMYSLGRYVTQGLKYGMESLYGETEYSLINFAGRLKTNFSVGLNGTLGEQKLWEKSGSFPVRSHYTEYSTQTIISYLQELISVNRETNREITKKELNVNIGERAIARANLKGEKGLGMRIISG